MRTIDISTDVFSLIWKLRVDGEETEDSILRRVLTMSNSTEPAEVKNLYYPLNRGKNVRRQWIKVTWVDDVIEVLKGRGGKSRLQNIYEDIRKLRLAAGRSVPSSLEATVRRTLEDHCRESENFRGSDLFSMPEGKGAGIWGLK